MKNYYLPITLHVVSDYFAIPCDGIIGADFLKQHKAKIDYLTNSFTIQRPKTLTVPLIDDVQKQIFVIPPRSEVVRYIPFDISGEYVVQNGQVDVGIFVASSIISEKSSYVRILNTNNNPCTIEPNQIKLIPLENFEILKLESTTVEKNDEILKKISKNVPDYLQVELQNLCNRFIDVFTLPNEKLTKNNFYKQRIKVKDNEPVYRKNYRVPHTQKRIIDEKVKKMLDEDIIEPSCSAYNSPILLVPKKSTTGETAWRLVIDYRELNKKVVADKYPLPRIEEILDELGRAQYFSVIDLMSGFHRVELEDKSRDFTSFSTNLGSFRFKRMPFGLNISPNGFSRMMSIAFSGLPPQTAFLYMDDIIVIGCSIRHHLKNLEQVFRV